MEEKNINNSKEPQEKKKSSGVAKTFRIIGMVLAFLIIAIGCFDLIPIRIGDISDEDMKYEHGNDWCSYVDDEKKISEIVIPGTHDSATQYISMPFFSKTQGSSMQKQLECGYRFFDMRLKLGNHNKQKGLFFVHGPANARKEANPFSNALEFSSVIDGFVKFLNENPNEFIICSIKKENKGDDISEFQNTLKRYLDAQKDSWYLENKLPAVKDIRKKLVLLRRFENKLDNNDNNWGLSFLWENQNGTEGTKDMELSTFEQPYKLFVQDHYEYEIDTKWSSFEKSITKINADKDVNDLYVNYLSTKGGGMLGHPKKYATPLNQKFLDYKGNISRGMLVFDFADAKIAKKAIAYNNLSFK